LGEGLVEAGAEGAVDTTEERFVVGLLYQFESPAKLKDFFRFLFVGPKKGKAKPGASPPPREPEPPEPPEPSEPREGGP
jgi:hypothetical protein